jgi:RNA polymerase sigma factor (sigma-70 family)
MVHLDNSFQSFLDNAFPKGKKGLLNREEELLVIERAKAGDRHAIYILLGAHYRMILKVAIQYRRDVQGYAVEDLFQEGYKGFVRAIKKFEPERGFRFITYASGWIRQFIQRYAAENRKTVRIPSHVEEKLSMVRKRSKKKIAKEGVDFSEKEIFRIVKMRPQTDVARAFLCVLRGEEVPLRDEVAASLSRGSDTVQEDAHRLAHEPFTESTQIEMCAGYEVYEAVHHALSRLTPIEQEVLRNRYFLGKKLKEIAKLLVDKNLCRRVVSGERIRVIGKEALRKMRLHLCRLPAFSEFRENGYF